ncbi:unnamed protein product [Symbiodinium natans]|uniref:Uncharacterized protein n=1 Tax=Symbiodinium natans TaxID=878477 RepID=A0A812I3E8_9DINO|nr:unnamed protein product [Symbiodinium natans]
MNWESYAKFRQWSTTDADAETSSDDDVAGNPHTEEGLMRAFVFLHERRSKADLALKELGLADAFSGAEPPSDNIESFQLREGLVHEYDDICSRILLMDGARDEKQIRLMGHAVEVSHCRYAAGKIAYSCRLYGLAMERSSQAVWVCEAALEHNSSQQQFAIQLLRQTFVDVLVLRSMTALRRGSYRTAREDALLAHSQSKSAHGRAEETLNLALRCEMALHAGGPGDDGEGRPLTPEAACALKLDVTAGCAMSLSTMPRKNLDLDDMD